MATISVHVSLQTKNKIDPNLKFYIGKRKGEKGKTPASVSVTHTRPYPVGYEDKEVVLNCHKKGGF